MERVGKTTPFVYYTSKTPTPQIPTALFLILRPGSQKCGHFLARFFPFRQSTPVD